MNVQETKQYLEETLPGFSITVHERWENKPNNRFEFERDGVEAAMLFAQKLSVTREFLNDVATAVKKRFDSPKAMEKAVEKLAQDIPAESPEPEAVPQPKEEAKGPVKRVLQDIRRIGKPNELELKLYASAKQMVADFEEKYPMT